MIPLVQCNVMYERYHFFGPPCILMCVRRIVIKITYLLTIGTMHKIIAEHGDLWKSVFTIKNGNKIQYKTKQDSGNT